MLGVVECVTWLLGFSCLALSCYADEARRSHIRDRILLDIIPKNASMGLFLSRFYIAIIKWVRWFIFFLLTSMSMEMLPNVEELGIQVQGIWLFMPNSMFARTFIQSVPEAVRSTVLVEAYASDLYYGVLLALSFVLGSVVQCATVYNMCTSSKIREGVLSHAARDINSVDGSVNVPVDGSAVTGNNSTS